MAADGDYRQAGGDFRLLPDGPGHIGEGTHAQYVQRMRVIVQRFPDDEGNAFRDRGIIRAVLPGVYRHIQPHGGDQLPGGGHAFFHGTGLREMLGNDSPDDQLRAEQRIGDGKRVIGLTGGIRVDDDTAFFLFGNLKMIWKHRMMLLSCGIDAVRLLPHFSRHPALLQARRERGTAGLIRN